MAGTLGTIRGQMILDVKQALAAYTAARAAHLSTMTALSTGGAAMVAAGAGIAAVGVALAYGLGKAVSAAAEFERKLDFFGAVSASTAAEMEKVRAKALELGKDTIFSAGQIADSFVELGKAGVSASDIVNGVGAAVANLGAAADIPLDTAANIILSATQTFGLAADQAVMVADKLAGAANASIVEVQDLGVSMKYAGGVANALGFSFDDVNTALAILGKYGIRGSTAGTSLRQTMVSLTGATEKAKAELKELGIITEDGGNKFFDAQGKAKPLAEVFQILQDAMVGYTDEQEIATLKTIFQSRALGTVLALTKEGSAGFAEMYGEISKTTALDVATERLDNLSGDVEILKGNLETLAIESGSLLQDFARGVVQGITDVVQWFSNLSDGTQLLILKIVAISAAVFIIVGIFGVFAGSILQIIGLIMKLYQAGQLIVTLMRAITAAIWLQNAAWLANPITWIILAIVALIAVFVLLWNNNEGFRNFFIKMWEGIKTATAAVVNWFKSLPDWFATIWNNIKTWTLNAWNSILDFFRNVGPWILAALLGPIGLIGKLIIDNWDKIKEGTQNVWNAILSFFSELPGKIGAWLSQLPYLVGYWISFAVAYLFRLWLQGWQLIINSVIWVVEQIVGFFQALPGYLAAIWQNIVETATNWWNNIVNFLTVTVPTLVGQIVSWFQQLPDRLGAIWSNIWTTVVNFAGRLAADVVNHVSNTVNNVRNWFQQLPGVLGSIWANIVSTVTGKAREIVTNVTNFARDSYNNVQDWLGRLPGAVEGIFNRVLSAIRGLVTRAFNAVRDFAKGLWDGFRDGLGIHSPSYIEEAMWKITDVLDDETSRMAKQVRTIQGLGNNISEVGNNLGFENSMDKGLAALANSVKQAQDYQAQLTSLAASSTISLQASATNGATAVGPTILVEEGDTNNVDITWNAAPNDQVTTKQQARDLLGKAGGILTGESSS